MMIIIIIGFSKLRIIIKLVYWKESNCVCKTNVRSLAERHAALEFGPRVLMCACAARKFEIQRDASNLLRTAAILAMVKSNN